MKMLNRSLSLALYLLLSSCSIIAGIFKAGAAVRVIAVVIVVAVIIWIISLFREKKQIMEKELQNLKIARFALNARYQDLGEASVEQLKRHLLDAFGSLIHAGSKPAIQKLVRQYTLAYPDKMKTKVEISLKADTR